MARSSVSVLRFGFLKNSIRRTWLLMSLLLVSAGLGGCMLQLEDLFPVIVSYGHTAKEGTVTATDIEDHYIIKMNDAPMVFWGTNSGVPAGMVGSMAKFISKWDWLFVGGSTNALVEFDDSGDDYAFVLSGPVFDTSDDTLWYHAELLSDGSTTKAKPPTEFQSVSVGSMRRPITSGFVPPEGVASSISMSLANVNQDSISLKYSTLLSSNPQTNGQRILLFSGSDVNVYGAIPLHEFLIASNSPLGCALFMDVSEEGGPYVGAYATSADPKSICATVAFDQAGNVTSTAKTTISLSGIGATSVNVAYSTPTENTPKTNGNWIGVWQGNFDAATPPLAFEEVSSDRITGYLKIENVNLQVGQAYTIAYIMGADATTVAATVSFEAELSIKHQD